MMRRQMRYHMLSTAPPVYQAETVASHYLSMAVSAQHLLKLVELYKLRPDGVTEEFISMMLEEFKDQHRSSLGLELEWDSGNPDDPAPSLERNFNRMMEQYLPQLMSLNPSTGDVSPVVSPDGLHDLAGGGDLTE